VETVELRSFQIARHPARSYSSTEETLVGVNIADSVEEFLIEQSGLDGCAPVPEQSGKFIPRDAERLLAGPCKT
jgi:hypothetical protein